MPEYSQRLFFGLNFGDCILAMARNDFHQDDVACLITGTKCEGAVDFHGALAKGATRCQALLSRLT